MSEIMRMSEKWHHNKNANKNNNTAWWLFNFLAYRQRYKYAETFLLMSQFTDCNTLYMNITAITYIPNQVQHEL